VQGRWYGENCAPHNVSTNDEVKAGPPIEVKVYVTVNGNKQAINPDREANAGGVCAGSAVGFIVEARDPDTHICQKDGGGSGNENLVLNKLVPTNISVKISVDGLTDTWEVPLRRRGTEWHFVWDNIGSEWVVPVEVRGRWIHFVFQGMVDDVACDVQAHTNSNDTAVDMSRYRAKIAVPKIDKIVVKGTEQTGPVFIYAWENVELEAKIIPEDAQLPSGQPLWFIASSDPAGGTANINPRFGSPVVNVDGFNKPAWYSVAVTLCNCSNTIDILAVEVDFVRAFEAQYGHHVNRIIEDKFRDEEPLPDTNDLHIVAEETTYLYLILRLDYRPQSASNYIRYNITTYGHTVEGHIEGRDTRIEMVERSDRHRIAYGLDKNQNGKLEPEEYALTKKTNKLLWIVPYLSSSWEGKLAGLRALAFISWLVGRAPIATTLLRIFVHSENWEEVVPITEHPTIVMHNRYFNCFGGRFAPWLTHNAGLMYEDNGDSSIERYIWGPKHSFSQKIARSAEIKTRVREIYNKHLGEIKSFCMDALIRPGTVRKFGPWLDEGSEDITFVTDDDLYFGVARAKMDWHAICLQVRKTSTGCVVEWIQTRGRVSDLYDFNVEVADRFGLNSSGAIVELGYHGQGVRRIGGRIFMDSFEWNYIFRGKELKEITEP
jgi:hypothetical protein